MGDYIEHACLCWVGHGGCGGCSGLPSPRHEPTCGWEQNPDCPEHGVLSQPIEVANLPEGHTPSPSLAARLDPQADDAIKAVLFDGVEEHLTGIMIYDAAGEEEIPVATIHADGIATLASETDVANISAIIRDLSLYGSTNMTVEPGTCEVTVHDHAPGPN